MTAPGLRLWSPTLATDHPSDEDLSLGTPVSREDGAREFGRLVSLFLFPVPCSLLFSMSHGRAALALGRALHQKDQRDEDQHRDGKDFDDVEIRQHGALA